MHRTPHIHTQTYSDTSALKVVWPDLFDFQKQTPGQPRLQCSPRSARMAGKRRWRVRRLDNTQAAAAKANDACPGQSRCCRSTKCHCHQRKGAQAPEPMKFNLNDRGHKRNKRVRASERISAGPDVHRRIVKLRPNEVEESKREPGRNLS